MCNFSWWSNLIFKNLYLFIHYRNTRWIKKFKELSNNLKKICFILTKIEFHACAVLENYFKHIGRKTYLAHEKKIFVYNIQKLKYLGVPGKIIREFNPVLQKILLRCTTKQIIFKQMKVNASILRLRVVFKMWRKRKSLVTPINFYRPDREFERDWFGLYICQLFNYPYSI